MGELGLVAMPILALAYLTVVGAGAAVVLAPRFPGDAQAALAPLLGAALIACASVLVPLGVPARPVTVALAVAGVGLTVIAARRVMAAFRRALPPLAVAVAALAVAAIPGLARGNWQAASLYGSTDPYHWVSQARSYLEEPAPRPATEHPDRITYERPTKQHWAFGLPFGTLQLAWLSGDDPVDVYAALSVVIFSFLPLATFLAARACLAWSPRWSLAAGLALAGNSALLFASHFSWQEQLAGSTFAFAGVTSLRLAIDRNAPSRELVLAAVFAAASLATYRLGFAPYFGLLFGTFGLAWLWTRRDDLRWVSLRLGVFVGAFALLAAPSIAGIALGLKDYANSGGFSTPMKKGFPSGQLGESIGLDPGVWPVQHWLGRGTRIGWYVAGTLVALGLLIVGARALRRARFAREDFLDVGAALTLVAWGVFLLPVFARYLSWKVLAYGAPFLILLVLTPFAAGMRRARLVLLAAIPLIASAAFGTALAIRDFETPGSDARLAALRLPRNAVVSVAIDDPWKQAWVFYYLRRQPLSVERPSFVLTGEGKHRDPAIFRHRPVDYVLTARGAGREAVWRGGDLALVAARSHTPTRAVASR